MNIRTEKQTAYIVLDAECTIIKTEADTEKLKRLSYDDIKHIELHIEAVREMDTAYFQMLLSLTATAEQRAIKLVLHGENDEIRRIGQLYGIGVGYDKNSNAHR